MLILRLEAISLRNKFSLYRNLCVIIFIFTLFFHSFQSLWLLGKYYLDTQEFAALCINKDKPSMHCNGKCQLYKQLNQTKSKEKKAPKPKENSLVEINLFVDTFSYYNLAKILFKNEKFPSLTIQKTRDFHASIFRPPSC